MRRTSPPDGNAFCKQVLADIEARTARGEKVRVVFDIDDTLTDGRTRTLAIARAWDQANGTRFFDGFPLSKVGHRGADTAAAAGLPKKAAAAFEAHWNVAFWDPANFVHDAAIPEGVKLAKQAKAAGADVYFLTGRIQALEPASIAQLRRLGLPDVDGEHVVSKPDVATKTGPFKAEWVARNGPNEVALFFTESRRDIGALQAVLPKLPAVLLDSRFAGSDPVAPDTPVFRR